MTSQPAQAQSKHQSTGDFDIAELQNFEENGQRKDQDQFAQALPTKAYAANFISFGQANEQQFVPTLKSNSLRVSKQTVHSI